MVNRKTRTICFRVSEQDYQALKGLCDANGGRSVSEVARSAVHDFLVNGADPGGNPTLEGLSGRLNVLESVVERLAQSMRSG